MTHEDDIICTCFQVTRKQIIETYENETQNLGELKDKLMIGYGCGSCEEDVKSIHKTLSESSDHIIP